MTLTLHHTVNVTAHVAGAATVVPEWVCPCHEGPSFYSDRYALLVELSETQSPCMRCTQYSSVFVLTFAYVHTVSLLLF